MNDLTSDALPLTGIRVADFSRVLAGPYASMLLADLGADVVKVERPHIGDETRSWGPPFTAGESAYFLSVNRNKRSLLIDMQADEDRLLAQKLIKSSDVFLHNFKNGDDLKLGLDRGSVTGINPRIIYAAISAFGRTGPDANKPGYDLLAQALTGFMSINGSAEGPSYKIGVALVDILTGLNTALGIVASLYERGQGGTARRVDSSLLEVGLSSLVNVASSYLLTQNNPKRHGNAHPNIVPYQEFMCTDAALVIAVANNKQFGGLARALSRNDFLENPDYADNPSRVRHRLALCGEIAAIFKTKSRESWLNILEGHQVPCAPVNQLSDVFESAQVATLQSVTEVEHPKIPRLPQVAAGLRLDDKLLPIRTPPPLLGQHDDELREELAKIVL